MLGPLGGREGMPVPEPEFLCKTFTAYWWGQGWDRVTQTQSRRKKSSSEAPAAVGDGRVVSSHQGRPGERAHEGGA